MFHIKKMWLIKSRWCYLCFEIGCISIQFSIYSVLVGHPLVRSQQSFTPMSSHVRSQCRVSMVSLCTVDSELRSNGWAVQHLPMFRICHLSVASSGEPNTGQLVMLNIVVVLWNCSISNILVPKIMQTVKKVQFKLL